MFKGSARFSIPTCNNLQQIGDDCTYTNLPPINTTVVYPDGEEVEFTNVYRLFCPCEAGLYCSSNKKCFDPTLVDNYNSLENTIY